MRHTGTGPPLIAALILLAFGLAACGETTGSAGPKAPATTSASDETPTGGTTFTEAKIGQDTWTYEDGLEVQVNKIEDVTFSEWASAEDSKTYKTGVAVTVTLVNNTDDVFDAGLSDVKLFQGDDGVAVPWVIDEDYDVFGAGTIPPGRKMTWKAAFAGATADDPTLLVEVRPGFLDHKSAFFVP
jgi:hypothetical protein